MKYLFFCLFYLPVCFGFGNQEVSLVFVHLGPSIPPCIYTVMKQSRFFNQKSPIYLLCDEISYPLFCQQKTFLLEENITLIPPQEIPKTPDHHLFDQINVINPHISQGLWFYATKRLFLLHDFLRCRRLERVLHLENDTMLYADVEELLPIFEREEVRLAAPFQSLVGCIPCFLYIKDSDSFAHLISHILEEFESYQGAHPHLYLNDMQTLASYYRKFDRAFMLPLPTLMPEYHHRLRPRKSRFSQDNETPLSFLSLYTSPFEGMLFDAAGLGIFFNGNDPKFSPGQGAGTIHSRCLFHPARFSYFWGCDAKERAIPYLSFQEKTYRIINLHFHSKRVEEYASFKEARQTLPQSKEKI